MKNKNNSTKVFLIAVLSVILVQCSPTTDPVKQKPTPPVVTNQVDFWLTKGDQSARLQKQSSVLAFGSVNNVYTNIEVDKYLDNDLAVIFR